MLKAIREFFDRQVGTGGPKADPERLVQIAAAALWLEMTRADGDSERVEHEAVQRAVREKFGLPEAEAEALIDAAEQAAVRATDDYEFTSLINQYFTPAQKERVIEHLWQVAYADGSVTALEEHFVRRIAELLFVSHSAYIAAKLRAETRSRN
jgi:uncharacterized tellurite resistance protein B-like protein